jgi:molybdopterin-containing oxidoreductase family molybdopterin binding subunit
METKYRIPWYDKAAEAYPGNPLWEKYPLNAMSYHDNYASQSIHAFVPIMNEVRGATFRIHEDAANARGIKQGDLARIYNDRGHVIMSAIVTQGIRPDTICLSHYYQEEGYISGCHQDLTLLCLDPVTSNNNFNDMLVEVEKYEGGAQ